MQFTWQPQKRGIRLIVEDRHVKTVPKKLANFITDETIELLSFEKKRISESERRYLLNNGAYSNWIKNLSSEEKLVYELIKESEPISRRIITTPSGQRRELVYDNGIKVKVPDKVYFSLLKLEETTACLNY